jgi:hypothetical protein
MAAAGITASVRRDPRPYAGLTRADQCTFAWEWLRRRTDYC